MPKKERFNLKKELSRTRIRLVSLISHQSRTPLTAVKLFTEILLGEKAGKLNKKQKEYVLNIKESTERMIKLINDLLSTSCLEEGRFKIQLEPVQLNVFFQNIINEFKSVSLYGKKKAKISFKGLKEKMPEILIDRILTHQVIYNLIFNAIKYSLPNQCRIEVVLSRRKNEYLITVKDQGIGIDKKSQAKIFQKFFRTAGATKMVTDGTGLSLYVSKLIVKAMGGRIWFRSAGEGRGTTFYLMIPVKKVK